MSTSFDHEALAEALSSVESRIQEEQNIRSNYTRPHESETNEAEGTIYSILQQTRQFVVLTNFTEYEILDIWYDMRKHIAAQKRRGPPPKLSNMDAFLATLVLYKTGDDYEKLGRNLKIKPANARHAVERMRPIINNTLKERWWNNKPRPQPLSETPFPHVALLIDSNSQEVYHPKARFEEAKAYWDGKNKIYALKKEVAVMAQPPHYALFSQKGEIGSTHDFAILKKTYSSYLPYLQKTNAENSLLPMDQNSQLWACILDMGYIGPPEATPGLRR
jgi:hypothetical protein